MKTMRTVAMMLLLSMGVLVGCGGGDSTVVNYTATTGEELIDLKKAYDEGLLTEKEYNKRKEDILDRD
ncbi:MAG TPA: SHOCT domain-containing protein [Pseudomonadales bacterium]